MRPSYGSTKAVAMVWFLQWSIVTALVPKQQLLHTKAPFRAGWLPSDAYRQSPSPTALSENKKGEAPPPESEIPIPEKIRWIFDETDGDFLEEEDDWGLDDLFLTDDEDDVSFLYDEDGPDAGLNEDDLMELHDMFPDALPGTKSSGNSSLAAVVSESVSDARTVAAAVAKGLASARTENSRVPLDNILATLESDLSYFYLRDELGISEDVMWKITNDAPSVLGLKANNVRNKVRVLQSLVGFTDAEIRQLVTSQPTLLQLSAKKNLSPTILYWIRQLQMGKKELKALIIGCPALLKYSRANVHAKLHFFQTTMGYSLSECRKLLIKDPRLLTCGVKSGLLPRLNFLHKELDIPLGDVRTIAMKNPRILRMSVEQNLTPKCIFYFIMTLQLPNKDVAKILLKYPQILDYNLEDHILPIHHYLLSLEFSTYEFSRILLRYPRLITYSLMRMKRRIGYLRYELSLEANAIRRILYQCPQIVSLGQENLEATVEFLLQVVSPGSSLRGGEDEESSTANSISAPEDCGSEDLIDIDDKDALAIVQILVTGLPTLLALSIENNLSPKVDYLRGRLGQEELSNAMLRMPALLGYSLEKRIRPRMEKLVDVKLPPGKITVAITLREDLFDEWLERQIKKQKKQQRQQDESSSSTPSKAKTAAVGRRTKAKPTVPAVANPAEKAVTRKSETVPETPTAVQDDDDDYDGEGNRRVIEEGGKIIHWRRR